MDKSVNHKIIHSSCVCTGAAAVLIIGPSGSGKSTLALELMSRGAVLIADDRTIVEACEGGLCASCPPTISGMIEARGVGLLAADVQSQAIIRLVIDLAKTETDRLPPHRQFTLFGQIIPLVYNSAHSHFAAAILQYLKAGRIDGLETNQ